MSMSNEQLTGFSLSGKPSVSSSEVGQFYVSDPGLSHELMSWTLHVNEEERHSCS